MRPILTVLVCLVALPCSAAGYDWMLAQAPPATAARSPACTCVDCQCSGTELAELLRLRAYRDAMEAWVAKHDYRNPALYARPVTTSRVVATTSPIATYADDGFETVCENGVCRRVARNSYTSGYYTSGIPQNYGTSNYRPRTFGFKRIGSGFGSCANGQCQ